MGVKYLTLRKVPTNDREIKLLCENAIRLIMLAVMFKECFALVLAVIYNLTTMWIILCGLEWPLK